MRNHPNPKRVNANKLDNNRCEFQVWMNDIWADKFFERYLFSYCYFDKQMKKQKYKDMNKLNMFIIKKEISYIIMKKHGDMDDFIRKNNTFLKMGEEVVLNLTQKQVDTIRSRWSSQIVRDKKIKVDKMGITPIDLMIELLRCAGNLSEVARRLDISRYEIQSLIDSNKTLDVIYKEINEIYLDYVEWKLKLLVDTGDRNAIQYFLNNRGNQRGYGSYEARRRNSRSVSATKDDSFELL